ncbi:MAG TPA: response regulator transcription factor [Polyangiaceae bacterium]|nr:response regulator transcription factor [Polyangiaceae bacterium]
MTKIVIVDDEKDILDVLEFNLHAAGYEVVTASTGREGLALALSSRPDLVILDLMLPDMSGTEVCKQLRESAETKTLPVLMLSARGEEIDRVVGFELGADDYVTKPFSVRELLLRVKAVLRRSRKDAAPKRSLLIEFGKLRIDREAHRVWVEQEEIVLTALEFKLLVTLFERKNRVQTRSSLLEHVWGIHAHISTRTVDAHVKRLREKLAEARDYVETVRGVGYRFKESPDAPSEDLGLLESGESALDHGLERAG